MFAYFTRASLTLEMTLKEARAASHPGECDADVAALVSTRKMRRQLDVIPDGDLRVELREYGAWDDEELQDRAANERRLVWIAACDIREEHANR